jgi:cytoskeletal protein CcmA (bactofilin family)
MFESSHWLKATSPIPKGSEASAPEASGFKAETNINSGSPAAPASRLSPSLKIKGQITGNEDLLIEGCVEGPISIGQNRLTVGQSGQVTGRLAAQEIIVFGKVVGNQQIAGENVEIKKDASVIGNVTMRRVVIENGASFKGSIEIDQRGQQEETIPP